MREAVKKRIVKLMKEVKFAPFPDDTRNPEVRVECQMPDHAFEAIAEHLVSSGITAMPHVKLLEVTFRLGPYSQESVVLFNENNINQEDAMRYAEADEYNKDVLVLPKEQWISLFRDGHKMD